VLITCSWRKWAAEVYFILSLWNVWSSQASLASNPKIQRLLETNPRGLRLFHPAFPLELIKPLSIEEADDLLRIQQAIAPQSEQFFQAEFQKLPWFVFPRFGVSESKVTLSKTEVDLIYEKTKYLGQLIWSHKLEKPESGSLLVSHWDKRLMFLTEYDPERGAKGFEIGPNMPSLYDRPIFSWPPLTLEYEIVKKYWQPIAVSENLLSTDLHRLLPAQMPHSLWEIIFLTLTNAQDTPKVYEALFDTGISPRRGLIAYLKLLQKVDQRTEAFNGIPEYRQIIERDILL